MATKSEYNYVQDSANATWSIFHNLDTDSVSVDVMVDYNGNLEKIIPQQILHKSSNQIDVIFSSAQTGRARVVGNF